MSERTSPEQSDGIIASPPRLMGEALYRIWSPDGPKGWPQKSPEEVARFHEALAEVEDTSGLSRFDYERPGHFTRAVLGNEPPPTFVIDQQKINGIMGDSSGRQGVVNWYKRLTGHDWESSGVYLPDMDTAIIYTPKPHNYGRDSVMAHESAHRKGVVLTRMLNEGFASLVEYLYRYPLNPLQLEAACRRSWAGLVYCRGLM